MNQKLIEQYQISFTRSYPFQKVVLTNNDDLTDFLNEWDLKDLEEYLIPEINKVIDGQELEFETGAETFKVIVDPVWTVFYKGEDCDYPKIPTADLKEILVAWSDYLTI